MRQGCRKIIVSFPWISYSRHVGFILRGTLEHQNVRDIWITSLSFHSSLSESLDPQRMFVDRHLLFRTWKLHRGKLYLRYPREIEIERERGYRLLGGVWQFLPSKNLLAASICRLPRLKQPFRRSSSDLKEYPGRGVSWKPANSSRIYCIDFERLT